MMTEINYRGVAVEISERVDGTVFYECCDLPGQEFNTLTQIQAAIDDLED